MINESLKKIEAFCDNGIVDNTIFWNCTVCHPVDVKNVVFQLYPFLGCQCDGPVSWSSHA